MKSSRILIAGVNGNIGSFLLEKLHDKHDVFSVSRSACNINNKFSQINLTDWKETYQCIEKLPKVDALIFLVGLAHKKGIGKEIDEFRKVNSQTLVNLLSALKEQAKLPNKIIFASTISVYGEKRNQNIYLEDSEKKPFSPYAVTKLEAEEYLLENYKKQSWILRFAPVYAPNFELNINRRTKFGNRFYRVGRGDGKLSLCNLENIGLAIQRIIEDKVPAGIYNISDAKDYSYNDLLNYVNAKWTLPVPRFLVKGLYIIGKMMNNIFLKENAIKLVSDNIFPSDKIRKYIELPYTLDRKSTNKSLQKQKCIISEQDEQK
ncbi:MAG: NAD-dependent epimerase/dehydratase family protein [Candidatus Marinimicrobia bacterium]|nr:NAD-dependent epimerase/dehydratase family protein [Candidatus Neomarinimicrobiota bacterium]MBT4281665.1 NAD-dependent epimerase/dehydratase family protein [Candidatus Neomarinimicrobiota bacterium]MBT7823384.1 NAD-dependent epimerase/dehydratase family protein [Candidatus Neomarinimicrobiota bacterium]